MTITVNGKIVYLGEKAPVYVDLRELSQGDSKVPVAYTTEANSPPSVMIDYDDRDEVLGVEVIAL